MLQLEVNQAQAVIDQLRAELAIDRGYVEGYCPLFSDFRAIDLFSAVKIARVQTSCENIAGVDVPVFEQVVFESGEYYLFDTPIWMESAVAGVKKMLIVTEKIRVAEEKKQLLERELREVSIRVNLFEKILIPRAQQNIKKIKIFLGDQQLAAVSQAKVAKKKIEAR